MILAMRKAFFLLILFVFISFSGYCQSLVFSDYFEDGDLSGWELNQHGAWLSAAFSPLEGNFSLRHNALFSSDTSWIAHPTEIHPDSGSLSWQWEWETGNWSPSGSNRFWFFLMADRANLNDPGINGYALGVNLSGFDDELKLCRIINGSVDAVLIDAGAASLVGANSHQGIQVNRSASGTWTIAVDVNGGFNNLQNMGSFTDASLSFPNPWIGPVFQHTATRGGLFRLDQIQLTSSQSAAGTGTTADLDTFRVMTYNLLRYPEATSISQKNSNLRSILQYLQPDLLGVNELVAFNGAAYSDSLLNGTLNINGNSHYRRAAFQSSGSSPIANMLYYNSDLFSLHSQGEISVPGQRNPNHYRLFCNYAGLAQTADTIWLDVVLTHLKAGSSPADEILRAQTADSILSWRAQNGNGFLILMGDLNVYADTEAAYQTLTQYAPDASLRLHDPLDRPGAWSANPDFADLHTQSTRTTNQGDGGATGGVDDRFDFILCDGSMLSGNPRIACLPGTYRAVGQDANHYNSSITNSVQSAMNLAVPDSIAAALFAVSDHLPVISNFQVTFPENGGLPVEYAWFTGKLSSDQGFIDLSWKSAMELNLLGYRLEGKRESVAFSSLDQQVARGSESEYGYRMQNPEPGNWYFRLVQLEANGEEIPGKVIRVFVPGQDGFEWQCFPQPARDQLQVEISSPELQDLTLLLHSMDGRTLLKKTVPGSGNYVLTVSQLPAGYYVLEVAGKDGLRKRKKVLVQP